MKHLIIYSFICFILFSACKNTNVQNSNPQPDKTASTTTDSLTFKLPDIPPMYTATEQRAEFLAKHYWDHFNFSDTAYIDKPVTEQAWASYIQVLSILPLNMSQDAIRNTFKKAEADKSMLNYFNQLADRYFYDPNSPYRNEEYYIPVLETLIESDSLSDMEKIRPKDRLAMALKNRMGTKAIDFTYTLPSGKQAKMHSLNTDYLLLYFHNPGCNTCAEITHQMMNSMEINELLSRNEITILTVYPDEEVDEWKAHLPDLSQDWINGYDKEMKIMFGNLYDLKAMPTLYLLDKNKTVLLKDAPFEVIEDYLRVNARQ